MTGVYAGKSDDDATCAPSSGRCFQSPSCPNNVTGCILPTFSSLAICSQCEDLDVQKQVILTGCEIPESFTSDDLGSSIACRIQFPQGSPVDVPISVGWDPDNSNIQTVNVVNVTWTLDGSEEFMDLDSIAGVSQPVIAVAYVTLGNDFLGKNGSVQQTVQRATQCAFAPCVNTYQADNSTNTTTLQNISTEYGVRFPDWDPPAGSYGFNYFWTANLSTSTDPGSPQVSNFYLGRRTAEYIQMALGPALVGNTSQYSELPIAPVNGSDNTYTLSAQGGSSYGNTVPAIMEVYVASNDFAGIMNNIALSMSTLIQESSSLTLPGQVNVLEQFVRVRWPWIALPLALEFIGIIFFAIGVFEASRKRSKLWKSSGLALLYHGFEEMPDGAREADVKSKMEEHGDRYRAKLDLSAEDHAWTFKTTLAAQAKP